MTDIGNKIPLSSAQIIFNTGTYLDEMTFTKNGQLCRTRCLGEESGVPVAGFAIHLSRQKTLIWTLTPLLQPPKLSVLSDRLHSELLRR